MDFGSSTIDRDWSWDNLADNGISITRDGQIVESFSPGRNVNHDVVISPQRSQIDLIFLDAIDLPMTTPPSQVPRIVSVGIAMSPYQRAVELDYSSTTLRDKTLWIELSYLVENQQYTFFALVLFTTPDPLFVVPLLSFHHHSSYWTYSRSVGPASHIHTDTKSPSFRAVKCSTRGESRRSCSVHARLLIQENA